MTQTIFLLRGLPGSGKSTIAAQLAESDTNQTTVVSADDYFSDEFGIYTFNSAKLPIAHADCLKRCGADLMQGFSVAVANTFTQRWEMESYLRMATELHARVVVVDTFNGGMTDEELAEKNTHGVPLAAITAMRIRYEHDWRSADPRPPWQRKEK